MRVFYCRAFTVMLILTFIELSSQFECLPNGAPIPGVLRGESSSPDSETQHKHSRPHSSISSPPHAGLFLHPRSRSPPAADRTPLMKFSPSVVLGYGIDQLEFIRLFSYKNPHRQFELRRYAIPVNKPIELLERMNRYVAAPTQERIVLSTLDGDVFAILDSKDFLAGLYACIPRRKRVKIKMENGKVTSLTAEEIKESPVGRHRPIAFGYRVEHLNHNHASLALAEPSLVSRSGSPPKHKALPTRLPSSEGSGYELDQLEFIRLISRMNPNHMFALRRYTFPVDKPILLYHGLNRYRPIQIQELIVLSTLLEDVFAILESRNELAGIYTYDNPTNAKVRVKINMRSGMVTKLTKLELEEVPVGPQRAVSNTFEIHHINQNPLFDLRN